jgi:ATP-dependent Lon protease
MRESVEAAFSFVRSQAELLGIDPDSFGTTDVHIHFPAGAIPKDGPSAGIAVATALASLLSDKPVRPGVAMTGEITLRGKVLPIGGVKEKVLAAYRAGIADVVLPRKNEKDLVEVPKEAREALRFHLVTRVDEVFRLALSELVVSRKPLRDAVREIEKTAARKSARGG